MQNITIMKIISVLVPSVPVYLKGNFLSSVTANLSKLKHRQSPGLTLQGSWIARISSLKLSLLKTSILNHFQQVKI